MNDHQRDSASGPGADLEYDLAHEASGAATSVAREQHVTVVTGTPGYDGDYSYDLAHDVPEGDPGSDARQASRSEL